MKKKKEEKLKMEKIRLIWNRKGRGKTKKEEKPKVEKGRPKSIMLNFILPGVYFAILSIGISLTLSGLSLFENMNKEVIRYLYVLVGLLIMFFSIPFLIYYGSKIKKES